MSSETTITAERSLYEELFQLAPDALVTTDLNGVIGEANRAAERLFQTSNGSQRGTPLVTFLHPADRRDLHRIIGRLSAGERVGSWPAWVLGSRGADDPVPVEITCSLHRQGPGPTVLWSLRDIRERHRSDSIEREALESKQREVEQYAAQVRGLEKAKSDFLDLASHELRGPLTLARGYTSMIAEGSLGQVSDRIGDVISVIATKLEEMNRLIGQMLDTARLEEERLFLATELMDLRELVSDAMRPMVPLAEGKDQRIDLALPDQPVIVDVDRERLRMVVANLMDNALKYSAAETTVTCTLQIRGAEARLAVADQGPGIDAASLETLFSRFGRIVTPETSSLAGTGLGLYLAREIARRHGGDVVAETGSAGSTFVLSLPLAANPGP